MILRLMMFLILCSCSGSSRQVLHLFTWSGFFSRETIASFEKEYSCKVVVDLYDSNESMYAKLKLGSGGYDLIVPSNYFLDILKKQKMVQELDFDQLPNLKNLDPRYYQEKHPFGVPLVVSFSGIGYRKDRIPDPMPSWDIFSEEKWRGRMTMLNDAREALGAALKYSGFSINTKNGDEVRQAGDQLIKWKRNLAKFESEQYKNGLASREFLIVQGYSTDILRVSQEDKNAQFLFPKEGTILSIDYMAIPVKASNTELAHAFINHMLKPEVAAANMASILALIPVRPAYELLEDSLKNDPVMFPSDEEINKMEIIEDLGESLLLYIKEWDRVKAS